VQVSNPGNRPFSEPLLVYVLNGGEAVYEGQDGFEVEAGETNIFSFFEPADLSAPGTYELLVYIGYTGRDQINYQNDTLRLTFNNYTETGEEIIGLQPANGARNISRPIHFNWTELVGAESYDLHLWPVDDSISITIVSNLDTTYYRYTADINARTSYEWKVIGYGYCDSVELESQVYSFTTSISPFRDPEDIFVVELPGDRAERKAAFTPRIYPNPGKGVFHIAFPYRVAELTVEVFNLQGQKVYVHAFAKANKRFKLNLSELAEGIYYLHLRADQQYMQEKMQIIR